MRIARYKMRLFAVLILVTPTALKAATDAASRSLLYMTTTEWKAADRATRTALAADFMRIYCGDVRMSLEQFIDCLDESSGAAATFDLALACSSALARGAAKAAP